MRRGEDDKCAAEVCVVETRSKNLVKQEIWSQSSFVPPPPAAVTAPHRANHRGKYFLADIKKIYLGHQAGEETTIKCLVMSSNLELGRSKTALFVNIQARSLYAVLFIHSRHATTSL